MSAISSRPVIQAWSWDSACIFRHTAVCFDGQGTDNTGLFLCDPAATGLSAPVLRAVAHLRARALWSGEEAQLVPDARRRLHAEQSRVLQAVEFRLDGRLVVAVRCELNGQRADPQRFQAWLDALQELSMPAEAPARPR